MSLQSFVKTFLIDKLVIEFCDAGSVQDILMKTGKGIAENIILAISAQTFKGLEYLHKQNQVHRDIKVFA